MKKFLVIALAITALRIIYLILNHRDLEVDESQYWVWSHHLAWGYHSKPPMISWVIHFTTYLFGDKEWAIRLFSPIVYFFGAYFIYLTGSLLFDRKVGFWSGITFLLVPGISYSSTVASTDPLLLMFWTMALFTFAKAIQNEKMIFWLLCGLCIGLGTLSKYTMLVFIPCAVLYLLLSSEQRFWLKKVEPYFSLLVVLLIMLPNLVWNYHHQNATFKHVIVHNADIKGFHFYIQNLLIFIVSQFGLFGPILSLFFILMIMLPQRVRACFNEKSLFLLCFSLPWLIVICIEALLSRAYANWAAVSYISAILLVVFYLYHHQPKWLKASNILHGIVLVVFFTWELTLAGGWHHWPYPASDNSLYFGKTLQFWQSFYPGGSYLVDSRDLWSRSIYYAGIDPSNLYVWDPKQKIDWIDIQQNTNMLFGQSFIFITHHKSLPFEVKKNFKSFYKITAVKINQRIQVREDFVYLYWLEGFLGNEKK